MPTYSFFNIILGFLLILSTLTKADASYLVQGLDIEEFQPGGNEEIQEPFSYNESELMLTEAKIIQSESNASPQEIPANSAVDTWQEVAEHYLCSSGKAVDIKDALKKAFPGPDWYVLVQDWHSGYAISVGGDYHEVKNKCQKNMLVWRGPGISKCSEDANNTAQTLLDSATFNVDDSGTIMDTILEREAGYGLDHYITASWDGETEVAVILSLSCYVKSNEKANYYISKFDPTATTAKTTRKTTHPTTSRRTDATTKRTTEATTRRTTEATTRRTTEATTRRTQSSTKTTAKTTSLTTEKTTSRTGEATTKSTTVAVPWEDVADSYLCSSGQAKHILDALDESYPGMDWYVFVQDTNSNWTGSMPRGESHQADNLCQKNMVVWRQPSSGDNCSEDAAASALSLINNATGNWNQSEAITDYIVTGEAEYGLDHDMTASWDDLSAVTDWSSKVQSSCHVDNNRTLYYISTSSASVGPYTLLGHTLSILVTTVVIVVAI